MSDTQQPNDGLASQVLEFAKTVQKPKQENAQNTQVQQQVQQEPEKKLDNKQDSLYIKGSGSDSATSDPELEQYQKVLNETFQGDPLKAVKSYTHTQKEFSKLQSSLKKYEDTINGLESVLEKNTVLKGALEAATKGESVENYLKTVLKPEQGKSEPPSPSSKLDSGDLTTADETTLVQSGYLDASKKAQLTALEWQAEVLRAQANYLAKEVPNKMLETVKNEWQKEQEKLRNTQLQEQLKQQNKKRFEEDFERVSRTFGFDFDGEHRDIFEEAVKQTPYMLDPSNPKLIRKDAFSIAVNQIMNERGIQPPQAKPLPKQQQQLDYNGRTFNGQKVEGAKRITDPVQAALFGIDKKNQETLSYRKKVLSRR